MMMRSACDNDMMLGLAQKAYGGGGSNSGNHIYKDYLNFLENKPF